MKMMPKLPIYSSTFSQIGMGINGVAPPPPPSPNSTKSILPLTYYCGLKDKQLDLSCLIITYHIITLWFTQILSMLSDNGFYDINGGKIEEYAHSNCNTYIGICTGSSQQHLYGAAASAEREAFKLARVHQSKKVPLRASSPLELA